MPSDQSDTHVQLVSLSDTGVVPRRDWKWRGMPGHLIVAARCCFHLHTEVGSYRISTIGCYHPAPDHDRRNPPETLGSGRLYETYVFRLGDDGEPSDWSEIDSEGYNEEGVAEAGHMAMCEKWAAWPETALLERDV